MSVVLVFAGLLSLAIQGGAVHAAPVPGALDSVVAAVKKQFAEKSSVRFSVARRGGPEPAVPTRISGAYRFNASGMYSADTTEITEEGTATGRYRAITIGREFWSQGYVRARNGKYLWKSPSKVGEWSAWQNLAGVVWGDDLINGINPHFLDLAASYDTASADGGTVEGVATTLHSGTVTVSDLGERQAGITFGTEEEEYSDSGPITWKLWVGPDHLPRRFHAVIAFIPAQGGDARTMTMNIVYRSWGSPVTITPPPEHRISDDW
ncbi:hypothetical protein [Nonomuraea gerenzanensis]|uniref:Lipoprotein n=1 Tax=Nonomuraea gerenzanensis TaxID=93944 RepID=A0A1M4ELR2_9ACTN|nr:hypothetical protein [Nonomuraea gerenzanensis]UBU11309.1 hypothetical protein LCN96_44495 [Nonomuraea gerenzanensis]SBO99785.1 hypothetical protein BN4615_P9301 [Nonomuraea gerenzanensis]